MATYVNDLRLKEITTGDEAGTWGTSTNTNLKLIGEALGYGTENCFAGNINTTVTVADGASDNLRAMYFKATSSATLTATRTLTIAPNTISRVMLIENATTGGQSIAISQGTGSNVTIPNGQTKMVYLDGAGAGASVVDAFNSFNGNTLELLNLSVGATVTAGGGTFSTVDINGGTIDGATLGGSSQVTITDADMNGGTIDGVTIGGSSAGAGSFTTLTASGDVNFDSGTFFVDASADAVGIGTTSPSYKTTVEGEIQGAALSLLALHNTGTNANSEARIVLAGGNGLTTRHAYIGAENQGASGGNAHALVFGVNAAAASPAEAMRIDSSGNLGIGTSSPGAKLEVFRTGTFGVAYQPAVYITNNSSGGTSTANTGLGAIAWATDSNATVTCSIEGIRENPSVGASSGLVFRTGSSSGGTERMRIDSSGNVGIGTSSPAGVVGTGRTLVVSNTSHATLSIQAVDSTNDRNATIEILSSGNGGSTADFVFGDTDTSPATPSPLRFLSRHSGTTAERARIDSSGNLLVGVTSLSSGMPSNTGIYVESNQGNIKLRAGGGNTVMQFAHSGGTSVVGSITVTSSATAYNTSSDARLKENIADAEDAGAKVDAIQVRQFDWKADGSHQDYGMIAQELMTVAPEAVSGDPESDDMMGVDYSKLVPMMLKEIQSLRARVAQLEGA